MSSAIGNQSLALDGRSIVTHESLSETPNAELRNANRGKAVGQRTHLR